MDDFEMPVFEGRDGERWIWDPTSHTYVKSEGNGLVPDRNHATGGDNDLFDPAQQDGNLFKPSNPLMEGIMARVAIGDFQGYSNPETFHAQLELENDYQSYQQIFESAKAAAAHITQNPTTHQQAMQNLASLCGSIWNGLNPTEGMGPQAWAERAQYENDPLDPRLINWLEIAEQWLSVAQEDYQYEAQQDQPGQTTIPGYMENPVYPDQQMPGEENSMVAFGSAMPGHAEDCSCPDCDQFRQDMELNPVQVHDTSPFPDRAPKPNRFEQDNSFPSSISRSNDRGIDMSDFDHLPTWDELIRAEAANLDSCPDCGGPMTKGKDSADCHSCGTRQPVIYTEAQKTAGLGDMALMALPWLAGPEVGAPVDAAMAAGEGAEGASAAGGLGGGLKGAGRAAWFMNNAMGVKDKLQNKGDQAPLADEESGPPDSSGAQGQGTIAAVEEFMRWSLRDYHGGTFGEEEIGGAKKNDGHDENPAEPETKGFAEQFGDSPELGKDVNEAGGTKSPVALQVFEMLLPQILQPHIDAGGTGGSDPMVQWLDQLLEGEFPGYRGGGDAMHIEVKDPNQPEQETGEAADGPDDDQDKDKAENAPPKQSATDEQGNNVCECGASNTSERDDCAMCGKPTPEGEQRKKTAYGMPGDAMPGGMGMAMGNPMMAEAPGPCQVCGLDDCVHKRGQQGNAQPNPQMMQQPNTLNQQNYMGQGHMGGQEARVHEAVRRPKMCPFHSELVEYSLELGDPKEALSLMAQHQFSEHSCKGGHKGGCNFKSPMVRQQYWDNHADMLRERREQQMPGQMTEVTQEIPSMEPIHEQTDYMPENLDKPDTSSWDDGGHVTEIGSDSAVGMPLAAHIHYAAAPDLQSLADYLTKQGYSVEFAPDGSLIVHAGAEDGSSDAVVRRLEAPYTPGFGDGQEYFTHVHTNVSAVEDGDDEERECARCGHGMSKGEGSCNFCDADPERSHYESKWKVAEIGIHQPEMKHDHHDPMMQSNWTDEMGEPLREGGDYELKSLPNYSVPDHITVKSITPDVLHIIIHGEMGMDYGNQITQQDMANEQYTFGPVQELRGDPGLMQPDTDSAPMDQDNTAQVDDLGNTTASLFHGSLEELSPAAQEHYASIAAMEQGPEMGGAPDRDWLMQGAGSYTEGVDPATLANVQKLAGKDYTPREQREFIDEDGTARNLDLLQIDDTHYTPIDGIDAHFLF